MEVSGVLLPDDDLLEASRCDHLRTREAHGCVVEIWAHSRSHAAAHGEIVVEIGLLKVVDAS